MSPLSLTNLQVSVGGQNVLQSTLNITYELDQLVIHVETGIVNK